jgi:glutathione S-transferase
MTLELHHFNLSTCSQKVRLVLAEKGLAWKSHPVDLLRNEQLRPEYLALNPNGVVPTLVHDGHVVVESSVIIEYLDDAFPVPPLRPVDPLARARMREWIHREDEVGLPAVGVLTMQKLLKPVFARRSEAEIEQELRQHPNRDRARAHAAVARGDLPEATLREAEARLAQTVDRMAAGLEHQPWLAGAAFSLADCTWIPFLDRMELLGLATAWSEGRHPSVADWLARCRARESYGAAVRAFGLAQPKPAQANPAGAK